MTVPNVLAGALIDESWGNTVADDTNDNTDAMTFTNVTTGFIAPAGWSIGSADAWVSSQFLMFEITVNRTGGTISVPSTTGNLPNQLVLTFPDSLRGPLTLEAHVCNGKNGRLATGAYTPSTGELELVAVGGTNDIVNTDGISLGGFVFLGNAV